MTSEALEQWRLLALYSNKKPSCR